MKKLLFTSFFFVSFSQNVFCAHESSKDLKKSKKKIPYREDKFASNTVEFIDFFKFVKERAKNIIENGTTNFDRHPNNEELNNLKITLNKDSIIFSKQMTIINLSGIAAELPESLQHVPKNSPKNFTINLETRYTTVSSEFIKTNDSFSIKISINNSANNRVDIKDVFKEIKQTNFSRLVSQDLQKQKRILFGTLTYAFDPMIAEATKQAPFTEIKKATDLPDEVAKIIHQYSRDLTQADLDAEKKRAKAQEKSTSTPPSTPSTASTSARPSSESSSTVRSLDEDDQVEGETEMAAAPSSAPSSSASSSSSAGGSSSAMDESED